jgi:hypothetical protein
MSRGRRLDLNLAVPAVTLAALTGVVFFTALIIVARPSGFSARTAEVAADQAAAASLSHGSPAPLAFPAKAVCSEPVAIAAEALRRRVQADAAAVNVAVDPVALTPGPADHGAGSLAPVAVQFEATGAYDAVLGLLGRMSRQQPQVFIDSLDLQSKLSVVTLKLGGRIYCSTSARP